MSLFYGHSYADAARGRYLLDLYVNKILFQKFFELSGRINLTASNSGYFKGCVRYIFLVCFLCLKDSPCETRKNVFNLTSKAFFVLEIIKF